jgi:signal transduction histidine kinase
MDLTYLAHEIINPLNIIVGCAELSKLEDLDPLIKNHLNEIIKQSMWCCQILENKMKDSVDASAFDIISKLENIIGDLQNHPIVEQNNINIIFNKKNIKHIKTSSSTLVITCDPLYFKIIINNLILNAIKHGAQENNKNINITLSLKDDNYIIEINNYVISDKESNKSDLYHELSACHNSYGQGLHLVDKLISKLAGKWFLHQEDNFIKSNIILPVR